MKIIFAFLLFTVLGGLLLGPLQPKPAATHLQMGVHWDDRTAVKGTVTVRAAEPASSDAIIDTKPLANGIAKLKTPAAGNSLSVTVRDESGTQLANFPINMANSQCIQQSEVELVFSKANKSLKSAHSRLAFGS